jgi:hypothetical protein
MLESDKVVEAGTAGMLARGKIGWFLTSHMGFKNLLISCIDTMPFLAKSVAIALQGILVDV